MSYILDALRKSEQSRQKERVAPSLDARHGPVGGAERARGGERWVWLGLSLLLCGVVAWLLWDKWSTDTRPTSNVESVSTMHRNVSQSVDSTRAHAVEQGIVSQAPINSAASEIEPDVIDVAPSSVTEPKASPLDEAPAYLSDAESTATVNATSPPSQGELDSTEQKLEVFADDGSIIIAPDSRAASHPSHQSVPDSMMEEPVPFQQDWKTLPRFNELPPSIQSRVPEMSITSHTHSSDGSFRSVIINGQKYREGDRVGQLTLEQITEDGAVFNLDGYRFHEHVLATWGS